MMEQGSKTMVKIRLSTLMESLEECCREANIEFDEGSWRENRSNLHELLSEHPVLQGNVFRLHGMKLRRTFPKRRPYYESGTVVVRGVHLLLDTNDWKPLLRLQGLFDWGVCFEECTIETEVKTQALLGLEFTREIAFRRIQFVSRANEIWPPGEIGDIPGTWLVNLKAESSISFEECNFRSNHVQIRAFGKTMEEQGKATEANRSEGETGEDDGPRTLRAEKNWDMLYPGNTPAKYALERIAFLRNRQIGRLAILPGTSELIVRAGNQMEALFLPGNETTCLPERVSLGLFEEIDATCREPLRHRNTFLELRQLGTDTKDDALVRASTAQIDKIDHFLLKNDAVRLSNGIKEYAGHFQRRAILGWGYWISNFNRSWLRCLTWLLAWYATTTMVACWMVWPLLEAGDVWSIVARPLHDVPFLAKVIQEHLPDQWGSVATSTKVVISLIGLVQTVVTGMLTFSLVRSLRR